MIGLIFNTNIFIRVITGGNLKIIFNILLFICLSISAYSQTPGWQIFSTANSGLPDNYVLSLAIESNGTKWTGTGNAGLARFDGNNWDVYNSSNSPLLDNRITAVGLNGDQELWVGTLIGGLAKFAGSAWTVYTAANTGVPITTILSIEISEEHNLKYFGTYEGLVKYYSNQWSVYNISNSGIPSNQVWSVAIEDTNLIWVGTEGGLARYDGNWTIYNTGNSGLPGDHINAIAIDQNGTKWFGTIYGLASFDGSNWTTYTTLNSDLPADHVTGIAIDSDNNKWLATFGNTGGLVKFDGSSWTVYNSSNTSLSNYLLCVKPGLNENIWTGSDGFGLAVLNENGLSAVEQINDELVKEYSLDENYPNPFNPATKIRFSVPKTSDVNLLIYDILGNEIATLVNEVEQAGIYEVDFDASGLPSGIYFYRLTTPGFTQTKKMILLK